MSAGGQESKSSPVYPKWAKPYITKGLERAETAYGQYTSQPSPSLYVPMDPRRRAFLEGATGSLVDPTLAEYGATVRGDYLEGSPYQDMVLNRALGDVEGRVGSRFAGSSRYGGGQWAKSLADAMLGTSAQYRDLNYQRERDRMLQASQQLPTALSAGEYVGGAFESDEAARLNEAYRQYRQPMEQLNEFLAQVYGNPAVQRPGTSTSSKKDLNWVDILSGLLGCHVADELFGAASTRAVAARYWVMRNRQRSLVAWYIRHSRGLARHVRANPLARLVAWPLFAWIAARGRAAIDAQREAA